MPPALKRPRTNSSEEQPPAAASGATSHGHGAPRGGSRLTLTGPAGPDGASPLTLVLAPAEGARQFGRKDLGLPVTDRKISRAHAKVWHDGRDWRIQCLHQHVNAKAWAQIRELREHPMFSLLGFGVGSPLEPERERRSISSRSGSSTQLLEDHGKCTCTHTDP